MRRITLIITAAILILSGLSLYSATGTPHNLVVKTDANNYLLVTVVTQTNPVTQGVFASRTLRTDSSGNLQVILTGTVTPTYPLVIPASTCAAPSLGLSGGATTGIAFTATPSILNCISGTSVLTLTASAVTSTVPYLGSATGSAAAPSFAVYTDTGLYPGNSNNIYISAAGQNVGRVSTAGITLNGTIGLHWENTLTSGADLSLSRLAANSLGSNGSMSITRGTITTDLPVQSDTVTWNAGGVTFTGWKLNVTDTASAAGSLLVDLQVGSVSKFSVTKAGYVAIGDFASVSATGNYQFLGRSVIQSQANGLTSVANAATDFGLQFNSGASAAPTFNNGTIDAGSRNTAGKVVLTGGNTGGTVTFSTNFTNAPFCTVTGTAATDIPQITSTSTSTLVVAGITANGTFYYLCIGRI